MDKDFNIIQHSKSKEYIYLFAHGQKCHPFCASILTTILDELDIEIMKKGAQLFEGKHNFKAYCFRASDSGVYNRTIDVCELVENDMYKANFFPETTYLLRVSAKGFGRNQIRLMMGTLIDLGRGNLTLKDIEDSLKPDYSESANFIAPASGLILNKTSFN